jgi:hypothetical protein
LRWDTNASNSSQALKVEKGQGSEATRMNEIRAAHKKKATQIKVIKRKRQYRWECFPEAEMVVVAEEVKFKIKVDLTL